MKRFLILFFLIFIYYNISFSQVESEKFLDGGIINSIVEEDDYLWVATYGYGIFSYSKKDDKWVNYSSKTKTVDNDLFHNLAVSKNYVWAGATEGLFIFDKKKEQWKKRKFALGGEFGNWIRSLYYDKYHDVLWIGRFRNLTRLDVAKQRFQDFDLTQGNDPKTNTFISISMDGDSIVWFGTEAGVHKYTNGSSPDDKNAWEFLSNKKGSFNKDGEAVSVSTMMFEKDFIWFGTHEFVTEDKPDFNPGGIYRFNRRNDWERISKRDGLPSNGIYCLERVGNTVWAGLYSFEKLEKKEYGRGLVIVDRLSGDVYPLDLNLIASASSTIFCMHFDGMNMWLGTDKGLIKIKIQNPLAMFSAKKTVEVKESNKVEKKKPKKKTRN